jgi:archaemetzincin
LEALIEKMGVAPTQRILVVLGADGYVRGLNFVFGVARNGWGGVVFTERLNPLFYGELYSEELYRLRILKESLHELGHALGLEHCRENCVMRFSNSVYDVDAKPAFFCPKCCLELNYSHPGIVRVM